jgi:hypothetical protein
MRKERRIRGLALASTLAGVTALAMSIAAPVVAGAAPASSPGHISTQQINNAAELAHIGGVLVAGTVAGTLNPPPPEPAFNGTPPLLFNGSLGAGSCFGPPCDDGNVMMTRQTGPVTIVPVFWDPSGYPMTQSYKRIITSYIRDVAVASGDGRNVFSVLNQYYGNNGKISYNVRFNGAINDTDPLPPGGCTLGALDTTGIYADGSGYNACLDDTQLQAEVDSVTAAYRLPHDLRHIYVLYLPKGVESCFYSGDSTSGNVCTINHYPTAAYCAYHSTDVNDAVYANMVYPIYQSPIGYTCGSDARFPAIESPNGNPDADTEISPTSHEVSESITDPDTQTGWYDSTGNEIGDDCAYVYGSTRGPAGAYYNQVINGDRYITQEEFSNKLFISSGGTAGCLPSAGGGF